MWARAKKSHIEIKPHQRRPQGQKSNKIPVSQAHGLSSST